MPLAARGFRVTARDLSQGAIARLRREAEARGLTIDAAVADMRSVAESVSDQFDVVVAFDNSIPHLLNDGEIEATFREFRKVLRPSGLCLCSVRDYDTVLRGVPLTLSYGERRRAGEVFRPRRRATNGDPLLRHLRRAPARIDGPCRLRCRRLDETTYQPILIGRVA